MAPDGSQGSHHHLQQEEANKVLKTLINGNVDQLIDLLLLFLDFRFVIFMLQNNNVIIMSSRPEGQTGTKMHFDSIYNSSQTDIDIDENGRITETTDGN
ncbi:hypothetical protein BLOT_010246 [Blomia tropicalis]|nr:hypothetical protein BLOT_010246 [Blomia tropicalis]